MLHRAKRYEPGPATPAAALGLAVLDVTPNSAAGSPANVCVMGAAYGMERAEALKNEEGALKGQGLERGWGGP